MTCSYEAVNGRFRFVVERLTQPKPLLVIRHAHQQQHTIGIIVYLMRVIVTVNIVAQPSSWLTELDHHPQFIIINIIIILVVVLPPLFYRGATKSSKLGVQFLGLWYYYPSTEKIDWSTQFGSIGYIITLFIKKLRENLGGLSNFWGDSGPPQPPVVVPMLMYSDHHLVTAARRFLDCMQHSFLYFGHRSRSSFVLLFSGAWGHMLPCPHARQCTIISSSVPVTTSSRIWGQRALWACVPGRQQRGLAPKGGVRQFFLHKITFVKQ